MNFEKIADNFKVCYALLIRRLSEVSCNQNISLRGRAYVLSPTGVFSEPLQPRATAFLQMTREEAKN